ncbi:DUF4232 domain-containing protein [Streptomyces sp. NBC_01012]|uniref:DUF4232 domain-containing protein n=1 Tax=Streptomyces sp. NBC_01012 TaxID=2903717 RepID=UPI003867A83B|nr:DUF4232 domain-containing protein [Streptomyces sp. NBC_01012]
MRNLRFRHAARTSALGTAALIAALSLTACEGGADPSPKNGAADSTSQESADTASDTTAATNTSTKGSGEKTAAGSGSDEVKGSGSDAADSSKKQPQADDDAQSLPTCNGKNTKVTITSVKRPVNHMLLTLTNSGSKACNAFYYPALRFTDAQAVPPVIEDSLPQAVVTISPGESAYAGITTSSADGSGQGGYEAEDLAIGFQNKKAEFMDGMVDVPLSKPVYIDSTLTVTHWQTEMDDALQY